jgi:hypothetical protein
VIRVGERSATADRHESEVAFVREDQARAALLSNHPDRVRPCSRPSSWRPGRSASALARSARTAACAGTCDSCWTDWLRHLRCALPRIHLGGVTTASSCLSTPVDDGIRVRSAASRGRPSGPLPPVRAVPRGRGGRCRRRRSFVSREWRGGDPLVAPGPTAHPVPPTG